MIFFIAVFACAVICIFAHTRTVFPKTSKWLLSFSTIADKTATNFVLSETGECQFYDRQLLQISAKSHINLWGYWLIFTNSGKGLRQYFIFKDSLSSEDQARLSRTIMRIKTSNELNA